MECNDKMTAKGWMSLLGLTFSAFVFNTSEFMPVSLLTDIAADFAISEAKTGMIISVYAWFVAIFSLPLMIVASRMEMKLQFPPRHIHKRIAGRHNLVDGIALPRGNKQCYGGNHVRFDGFAHNHVQCRVPRPIDKKHAAKVHRRCHVDILRNIQHGHRNRHPYWRSRMHIRLDRLHRLCRRGNLRIRIHLLHDRTPQDITA